MDTALQTNQRHKFLKTRFESIVVDDGLVLPLLASSAMVQTDLTGKLTTIPQVKYNTANAALEVGTSITTQNMKVLAQLECDSLRLGATLTNNLAVIPSISAFYSAPWLAASINTTVCFRQIDELYSIIVPAIDLVSTGSGGILSLTVPAAYLPSASVKILQPVIRTRSDTFITEMVSVIYDHANLNFKLNYTLGGAGYPSIPAGTTLSFGNFVIQWQQI
jgi:hypothetical protein